GDGPDPGDHPRAGGLVVVAPVRSERRQLEKGGAGVEQALDAVAGEQLAPRRVTGACLVGAALRRLPPDGAQLADEPRHVLGAGTELGVAGADASLEPHPHQKSERRVSRPRAIISAMRCFTRSTLSAMTSSSSLGFPSNSIGSPKWM